MQHNGHTLLQARLLEDWQRGLPLIERPYAAMAAAIGTSEYAVLSALRELQAAGSISRVGGVVRPNTLGASTLAAIAVPDLETESVAAMLNAEAGINHVYLRENEINLWFVVTGPDTAYVARVLQRVGERTGRQVLDLRLQRAFHIDLGFSLDDPGYGRHVAPAAVTQASFVSEDADRALVQSLTDGLPLSPTPFADIARRLNRSEGDVLARLTTLVAAGVVPRIGVIVRHRALGWRSNAMVVWDVPPADIERIGTVLAAQPGINLCYQRTRYPQAWAYNLYCMVHARSRDEALDLLARASAAAGIAALPRRILFSLRCYKQTGALLQAPREAA